MVIALVALVAVAAILFRPPASPSPTPTPTLAAAVPSGSPGATQSRPSATDPAPTPGAPTATPTATPTQIPPSPVDMPFVPVVGFWSTETSISMNELRAAPGGGRYSSVVSLAEDVAVLEAALGTEGIQGMSMPEIEEAVRSGALAIVRVTDVDQSVHALAIDGVSLFGNDRVTDIETWPLRATVSSSESWDPSTTWTLVAAGDVMMDRGVALELRSHPEGGDYLFDGGTARITGIRCCSFFGYDYPTTERTGNRGAVRELFQGADIAMANLESAVLVDAPYHATGFTFTADASLLDSVDEAGFDFMSLANNHVRNAGERGILTAMEELDNRGIAHSGVGRADEAGVPGILQTAAGVTVAIISCDAIRPGWEAVAGKVGTFNCKRSDIPGSIQLAREQGADVVIVFPHWCCEYKPKPPSYAPELAQQWFDAGADLITGAHPHIAGAMGDIDGKVVFYSTGNLIFDQDFRQSTMMGVIPEMTFSGTELVQIELHPTLIIDAQPNLIAPEDGGQFVLDQMRVGSEGLLGY